MWPYVMQFRKFAKFFWKFSKSKNIVSNGIWKNLTEVAGREANGFPEQSVLRSDPCQWAIKAKSPHQCLSGRTVFGYWGPCSGNAFPPSMSSALVCHSWFLLLSKHLVGLGMRSLSFFYRHQDSSLPEDPRKQTFCREHSNSTRGTTWKAGNSL